MVRSLSPRVAHRRSVFSKKVGRGIYKYRMIEEGDRILISVSGGKDSLALCLALAERKNWVPVNYGLEALFINWQEYPARDQDVQRLLSYLAELEIPCQIIEAGMFPPACDKSFNCYICSRNRKRLLFREAEKKGITKIALGHHLDDMIETTLLNLFFKGEFATMMPVQSFFNGKFQIIRPMCEVQEREIVRLMKVCPLPVFSIDCPRKDRSPRIFFKEMIRQAARINKHVKENIQQAPSKINWDYLPRNG